MANVAENTVTELVVPPVSDAELQRTAVVEVTPISLLQQALKQNADVATLERLTGLYERWQAAAARSQFVEAMVAFRADVRPIVRSSTVGYDSKKEGGQRVDFKHATLATVDEIVTPILCSHGLTYSWKVVEQAKDWIRIRCTVTHISGHSEHTEMGGPPDHTGGKNPIQAIGSTASYLERYTLIAILGLATKEQDDDGNGGEALTPARLVYDALMKRVKAARDDASALAIWQTGNSALKALGEPNWVDKFKDDVIAHRHAMATSADGSSGT